MMSSRKKMRLNNIRSLPSLHLFRQMVDFSNLWNLSFSLSIPKYHLIKYKRIDADLHSHSKEILFLSIVEIYRLLSK